MGGKHKKCKFIDGCLLIASFGYKDGTGTKFCGDRIISIWNKRLNAEIDLTTSTLFKFEKTTGILTVQTANP